MLLDHHHLNKEQSLKEPFIILSFVIEVQRHLNIVEMSFCSD